MSKVVRKLLLAGTYMGTIGLVGSVLLQIFARFFLESAPPWTEEASRFFFIYTMSFSAGLALESGDFVQLDIVYDRLGSKWKHGLNLLVYGLVAILFLVVGIYGIQYVKMGWSEKSPSLKVPMAISFISLLVMSFSITYHAILLLTKQAKAKK
ncbi:MAG: TRAP transporter small permease [Cyclobacteriaceae bacterium]